MIEYSAGILFIYKNKLLLVHPTGKSWYGSYSYPKGKIEKNETPLDAAIRETKEEIGIDTPINLLDKKQYQLNYKIKNKGQKIAFYYICRINNLSDINLNNEVVPKNQLQLNEVDWAGFVDYNDAKKRLSKAFLPLLKHYKFEYFQTFEEFIEKKNII